jgi:hypothetical protein
MIKKLAIMFLLLLSSNVFAQYSAEYKNEFVVKIGIIPYSTVISKINWSADWWHMYDREEANAIGFSGHLEYFRRLNEYFLAGIGFSQYYAKETDNGNGLYSLSVYLAPKLDIYKNLFLVLQLGANYTYIKESDFIERERGWEWERKNIGLHYGAGIGYSYKNFIFEFLYSSDNSTYKVESEGQLLRRYENHMNYHTFNFNVGYKISFGSDIQATNKDINVKEPKKAAKERKKSERELLIEQNELLKKQI